MARLYLLNDACMANALCAANLGGVLRRDGVGKKEEMH